MNIFEMDNKRQMKKNKFDLSYEKKLTTVWGQLTPIMCQEILPGDSFKVDTQLMIRFAPMLAPIMHRVDVYTHYFYVPNRIVWDNWEDFITGGENYDQNPTIPSVTYGSAFSAWFQAGELSDHLGFPAWNPASAPTITGTKEVNALPFRAYQKIYNEWYRDQDLESPVDINFNVDGAHSTNDVLRVRYRAWEKDYFTSARPNAQKGNPVNFITARFQYGDGTLPPDNSNVITNQVGVSGPDPAVRLSANSLGDLEFANASVQDLRRAEAIQSYLERLQRTGNRYREYLAGIWGVVSSDARIDIPEYLGGGKTPVVISEVLTTTNQDNTTTDDNVAGELYGHGVGVANNHGFKRSFEEHGFVIGIMSVVPKAGYSEGLSRMFTRSDRFDYYVPDLALIGEQAIKNQEVGFNLSDPENAAMEQDFGYQQRYAEYKYPCKENLAGDMRYSLDYWHLNRQLGTAPNLTSTFVQCREGEDNLNRIFNVIDSVPDTMFVQCYHKIDAIRPIPYRSIPDLT